MQVLYSSFEYIMKTHLTRLQMQIDEASGNAWHRSKPQHTQPHKNLLLDSRGDEGVPEMKRKLDFLTSEHPKNCIYVT